MGSALYTIGSIAVAVLLGAAGTAVVVAFWLDVFGVI